MNVSKVNLHKIVTIDGNTTFLALLRHDLLKCYKQGVLEGINVYLKNQPLTSIPFTSIISISKSNINK